MHSFSLFYISLTISPCSQILSTPVLIVCLVSLAPSLPLHFLSLSQVTAMPYWFKSIEKLLWTSWPYFCLSYIYPCDWSTCAPLDSHVSVAVPNIDVKQILNKHSTQGQHQELWQSENRHPPSHTYTILSLLSVLSLLKDVSRGLCMYVMFVFCEYLTIW